MGKSGDHMVATGGVAAGSGVMQALMMLVHEDNTSTNQELKEALVCLKQCFCAHRSIAQQQVPGRLTPAQRDQQGSCRGQDSASKSDEPAQDASDEGSNRNEAAEVQPEGAVEQQLPLVPFKAPIWVHGPVRGLYWVVGTYVGLLQAGAQACGELALSVTEHALLSALPPGKSQSALRRWTVQQAAVLAWMLLEEVQERGEPYCWAAGTFVGLIQGCAYTAATVCDALGLRAAASILTSCLPSPKLEQLEAPAVEVAVLPAGAAEVTGAQEVTPPAEAVTPAAEAVVELEQPEAGLQDQEASAAGGGDGGALSPGLDDGASAGEPVLQLEAAEAAGLHDAAPVAAADVLQAQAVSTAAAGPLEEAPALQAPVGEAMPPVAVEELAAAAGALSMADSTSAAYTDAIDIEAMLEGMVEDVVASVVLQVADEGTARLMEAVHEEDMSMVPLAEMPVSISSHSPSSPEEVLVCDVMPPVAVEELAAPGEASAVTEDTSADSSDDSAIESMLDNELALLQEAEEEATRLVEPVAHYTAVAAPAEMPGDAHSSSCPGPAEASMGDVMPTVAGEELAAPGDAPSVAEDPCAANAAASRIKPLLWELLMAEEAAARLVEPVHDSTAMAPLAGTHGGAYHSSSRRSSSVNSATAPGHPRRPSKRGWRWQAPVGDIRPPVAWKELAAAGGAPFVAEDPSAAYTDASTVQANLEIEMIVKKLEQSGPGVRTHVLNVVNVLCGDLPAAPVVYEYGNTCSSRQRPEVVATQPGQYDEDDAMLLMAEQAFSAKLQRLRAAELEAKRQERKARYQQWGRQAVRTSEELADSPGSLDQAATYTTQGQFDSRRTRPRSSDGGAFLQQRLGSSQPSLLADLQVRGAMDSPPSRRSSCESDLGDNWLNSSSTCCSSCRSSSGGSSRRTSSGSSCSSSCAAWQSDGGAAAAPAVQQQVVVKVSIGVQVDSPPLEPTTKTAPPPPAPAAAPKAPPPPLPKGPAGKGPVGRAPAPPPPPPPRPGQQPKPQAAAAAAAAGPSTQQQQQQFGDIRQNIVAFGQGATRLNNVTKAAEQKASGGVVSSKAAVKGPQGDLNSQIIAAGKKRSGEADKVAADAIQYAPAIEAVRVAILAFKPQGSGVNKALNVKAFVQQQHAALAGLSDRDAVLKTVPNWPAEDWQKWEAVASSVDKYGNEGSKAERICLEARMSLENHLVDKLGRDQREAAKNALQQPQPQHPTDSTLQQQQQQQRVVDPDHLDLELTPDEIRAYVQSLSVDEQLRHLTPILRTDLLKGLVPKYESIQEGLAKLQASSMAEDLQELGYSDWPAAGMQQRVLDKLQVLGRVNALVTLHNMARLQVTSITGNHIPRRSAAACYVAAEQGTLKDCGQFLLRLQQYVGSTRSDMDPLVKELLVAAAVAEAREGADVAGQAKAAACQRANTGLGAAGRVEELLAAGLTDKSSVAAVRSELCRLAAAQEGVAYHVRKAKAAAEIAASAAALARSRADATDFGILDSKLLVYGDSSRLAMAVRAAEAVLQTAQEQASMLEEAADGLVIKATAAMVVAAVVLRHSEQS